MSTYVSHEDFRAAAKRRLPRFLFDYADGGAMSETTMRRNRAELSAIELRQRVLCNVGEIDTSKTLFGRKLPLPVALGVRVAMALTGASTIADLNRSILVDRWPKSAQIEGKL